MKRKIEIQITILTISVAAAVIVSGYLAFQSLSRIVDTIHKEARPDLKLLLIKDIAANLNEVENTIRLYSLTGDTNYLSPYRQLDTTIQERLNSLAVYAIQDSQDMIQIDSIRLLANQKLLIWNKIRALHHSKGNARNSFSKLYSRIDTVIIQPDTIRFKPEEKKGLLKRIFGKKDTTTQRPIIIDKTKEKEIIKQEIAGIEQQITSQTRKFQAKEMTLLEQNIQLTQILNRQIARLELREQQQLETKTLEADAIAAQTYRWMAAFTIGAVILLIIIVIIFFRNLQRNRTYQKVLKKAKAEAESLTKAKEIFVATVSHEMRTPVNAIYGLTEQMLQKTNSEEMIADLKVVHKSAEHLIALVNDTLDFSKIESQKLTLEQIDFSPDEIITEVHTLHKDSALKKGIQLIVRNNTDKNLVLRGDPIRLKQILINLITNAIKFTSQGQVTLTVSSKDSQEQNYTLTIEVSDTGIGISKEDLTRIFDEFVQLNTDLTQKQRGAGLGLAIVKKLVMLQNGEIEVDSTPGKGTRFTLQIPYQKGNSEYIIKKPNDQLFIPRWFRTLHFLIADDEEFNLYLIKKILNKWGVRFTEAYNGQEAVERSAKDQYDLILMDIRMPVLDGYDAARLILQQNPMAKIVALTATAKTADIEKMQASGMHSFLQKPFTESDLIKAVVKLIPEKSGTPSKAPIAKDMIVDLDELEGLSGGDNTFFNEMLIIFVRSSEEALTKFHQHLENTDWKSITETAHKLAAPAKHLRAISLYNHLKQLENPSENNHPDKVRELIEVIEEEIRQINTILKQKIQGNN
jgi:signal transduction histidine kinase/CheY-like chemotaxis protein/HPt (histidine-containing phosphotransfer) domain-containing protein